MRSTCDGDIPAEVMAKGIWRGTLKGRRKDGSTFPAACTITALRDQTGRITHFVGVERDMTEDLALRDQLVHSERLSAIGELIAGVAHEINNPLQTIIGCTELMLDEPDGTNRDDLELVRKEAMRAGQIVRNLLAFARRGVSDRAPIDLNDLVRATAELRNYHLQQINIDAGPALRADAAAGGRQPRRDPAGDPQPAAQRRARDHLVSRKRHDHRRDLWQRVGADGRGAQTAARASVRSCAGGSSSRSSRRGKSGRAPGSGSRSHSASHRRTAASLTLVESPAGARFG